MSEMPSHEVAPRGAAPQKSWTALLGRRDFPVDGVEDYCTFLKEALAQRGIKLTPVRMNWSEQGWLAALRQLRRESIAWRNDWVLLQYTALSWSRRGFPFLATAVVSRLRHRGARVAVVFHEVHRHRRSSSRWIDRMRGASQDWVLRSLYDKADKCIFADPLETIYWLPKGRAKSVLIPIGANLPEATPAQLAQHERNGATRTVAVFCVSELPNRTREVEDIAYAVRSATAAGLRINTRFVGRGTTEAKEDIARAFRDVPGDVSVAGIVSPDKVRDILLESDALLCPRGMISPRRASAIAGIACGLPLVGYAGMSEGTPLVEAGVELVPYPDRQALGQALARVLADAALMRVLRERSITAQQTYFSWDVIAERFVRALVPAISDP